jgi:putative nucleotidyltransferase with HDIG domain
LTRREEILELIPEFNLIESIELRQKCLHVWETALEAGGWEPKDLLRMPFTLLIPDVGVNIVDHTRLVTQICVAVKEHVRRAYMNAIELNDDYLVASALLHDVGKLIEIGESEHGRFIKTRSGELLRHPISGACMCAAEGLPEEVVHAVACHSKEGDGQRRTPEAIIVNHADFISFETLK